jgi:hypothetical protein
VLIDDCCLLLWRNPVCAGIRLGLAWLQQGQQGPGDCNMRKPGPIGSKGKASTAGQAVAGTLQRIVLTMQLPQRAASDAPAVAWSV